MQTTVRYPRIGIDIDFERREDKLVVSVSAPLEKVENILQRMREFRQRVQLIPGFGAVAYHEIMRIEEAIIAAMEGWSRG